MMRDVIFDPQGKAVKSVLSTLGFGEVEDIRIGKMIRIRLSGKNKDEVKKRIAEMSKQLFANPVTEDSSIELIKEIKTKKK